MKKLFAAFALAIICTSAFAQISITSTNYYGIGSTVRNISVVGNDQTDSVAITNIVQSPVIIDSAVCTLFEAYYMIDTVVYKEPRTEGEFTEETFSFTDANGMSMHIKVSEEKAVCIGISGALAQMGLNDDMELKFEEPMDVILFPAVQNSHLEDSAHGIYKKHISEMQDAFNSFDSQMGPMMYSFLAAEYDSVLIDTKVNYSSRFNETGILKLLGYHMQKGRYEYLRETRQYTYVTNMLLHRIGGTEFVDINQCTLTNNMFAIYFGTPTINIGETLREYMGLSFPISSTSTTLNYWTANDNYPIVEMSTNADVTGAKKLAVRYGENEFEDFVATSNISINIYPNPATDILNIAIEDMENGIMNIYSTNGALVKEVQLNGSHNSINVTDLHNGCYFIRIYYGDKEIKGNFAKN